jgi:hypothetical protein
MLESLLVIIPLATKAMIMTQTITGIKLWKMCQRAPLPTKAGIIMTIPIPNFLARSITFLRYCSLMIEQSKRTDITS